MRVDWLSWSNPVSVWWGFLLVVSSINVFFWLRLHRYLRRITLRFELLVFLSAAYVFGCAFRAILPRADVQRICLFDTWLSSVFLGRSVATVAEICFVTQWALVLRHLAGTAESITTRNIANAIVPMIVLAECCSWYAVITTSYLGNTLENSLWVVTHRIALWSDEIAWMSLYFSVAVWTSLALCGFVLVKDRLSQYRATAAWSPRLMARLLAVEVTDAVQSSGAGRNRMRRMD